MKNIIENRITILLFSVWILVLYSCNVKNESFIVLSSGTTAQIILNDNEDQLVHTAVKLFSDDIYKVSGQRPEVTTNPGSKYRIKVGTLGINKDFDKVCKEAGIDVENLQSQWEAYCVKVVSGSDAGSLLVVGSNPRGTAYGLMELSRMIGVSPWCWWADVQPAKQEIVSLPGDLFLEDAPKVKFRGIFINDEGWGLEPWASKTFEPEVGNLGPKTYAKIFELLLRLKGNTIWPGMHPNTRPFFTVPGNIETADQWKIVVGTSHAEPMLRNNVGEWDHQSMGNFNYQTNASSVYKYWEQRVKESRGLNAIYTVGMRGIHDSGMQGFGSMEEKVTGLEKIIDDQRKLLSEHINENVSEVPQSFTPYKEVLEIYESGMDVPEDITIIWPDDNHGNIKRFSNEAEQQRSGGAGVYYHLSYLGSPHPYIWLSPMSPALIWREMTRAWQHNMNEIWIVNVGDIKRREWQMEFFMDLAWDIDAWNPENIRNYFEVVASRDISKEHGKEIAAMMWKYHKLAAERKPEFMGFNAPQWNGWPPVRDPLYSLWHYNDEVELRMARYRELLAEAQQIMQEIPQEAKDTYFQLVYYPVAGAAAMNQKWLYAYKSREYAKQGRSVANAMSDSAFAAFEEIKQLTHHYNHEVANGKWEYMVDYTPSYKKGSLVFWEPITKRIETEGLKGIGVAIEGQSEPLEPIRGNQPDIVTRASKITMDVSEAEISGEMERGKDTEGEFITWPDNGTDRQIHEPHWDKIPYEIDSPSKAVFEFFMEDQPGGIHALNLLVDHPDKNSDSWWVTLNDQPPYRAGDSVERTGQLKAHDFVLKPGLNKLMIHPREDGAKLYGIEFVQESQKSSPEYTGENRLPTFNRYTGQRHFIDIYSRGQETEKWSAKTSAPWIELSGNVGELRGNQDRIWVSVDFDQASSEKDLDGHIEITNGKQRYRVSVSAINQRLFPQSGAFIETNGVIAIPANQFDNNQMGRAASWRPLTGLGRSGSAMILQPMMGWYVDDLKQVSSESPLLEYEIAVVEGGAAQVILEAVPAFPLNKLNTLRCAASIDDGEPQWITFDMGEDASNAWQTNVLESRMVGKGKLHLAPGNYTFKLWGTDPSVNVDRILIDFGGLKPGYVGPENRIRR